MASSTTKSSLVVWYSLVLFLFFSLLAMSSDARVLRSHARVMKSCDFDSMYIFGEGTSIVTNGLVMNHHHIASAFNLPSPIPHQKAEFISSGASFAVPGATVMNSSFFIKNRIQPPLVENSLQSQINKFVNLLGSRLITSYEDRANKLQNSLFFINQPGISDYGQALLQGKSKIQASRFVPEVISTTKHQIRKLIFAGASNVLVSGLPGIRKLSLLHNDHLQQALVELKLEFPEVHIVYADYNKIMKERGLSQLAIEFAKARSCNYFPLGDLSYLRREVLLV